MYRKINAELGLICLADAANKLTAGSELAHGNRLYRNGFVKNSANTCWIRFFCVKTPINCLTRQKIKLSTILFIPPFKEDIAMKRIGVLIAAAHLFYSVEGCREENELFPF
jgi:hypothetical protein